MIEDVWYYDTRYGSYVELEFHPITLTWAQWGASVETLKDFYDLWESVTLRFVILNVYSQATLGRGVIKGRS